MHYKDYSTEDFIQDELFQEWVYTPDAEKDTYWKTFLEHHPHQHTALQEARQFLLLMNFKREAPDALLNDIQARINDAVDQVEAGTLKVTLTEEPKRRKFLSGWAYGVAAAVLIGISAGLYLFVHKSPGGLFSNETVVIAHERTFVTLPDSTKVWLNAGSRFTYPRNFADVTTRQVHLEGEGFFDVTENKNKPFVVTTSSVSIRVLGTAFNVRSYPEDQDVKTTLVRGKVSLESGDGRDSLLTLLPNQQAVFARKSKTVTLEKYVNTENYTAWRDGWIILDNEPFSEIVKTLERWYNVKITMEDKKSLSCTFSGKFKEKKLEEVLEIFESTEGIEYRLEGNTVYITGQLCEYN